MRFPRDARPLQRRSVPLRRLMPDSAGLGRWSRLTSSYWGFSMHICRMGLLYRCSRRRVINRRVKVGVISFSEYPKPRKRLRTRPCIPSVMKLLGPSRSYSLPPVMTSPKSISPESRQPLESWLKRKFSGIYSPVRITGDVVMGMNVVAT